MTAETVPDWLSPDLAGRPLDSLKQGEAVALVRILVAYVETDKSEDTPELLDQSTVMKLLGVSRQTLWNMRKRGGFPAPITIGSSVRWRKSAVVDFINANDPANVDPGIDPLS
jgi:predicted DNA-binding transcriptional regulator AlpA